VFAIYSRSADTTDGADTTRICDGGSELGASSDVHARKHDRVVDADWIVSCCSWKVMS